LLPLNFNCNSTEDFCIRIYSSNPINAQVVSTNHFLKQKIDEAFLRTIYFTIGLNSGKLAVPTNQRTATQVIDLVHDENSEIQNIKLYKYYQNDVVFIMASFGDQDGSNEVDLQVTLDIQSSNYHWISPYTTSSTYATTIASKYKLKKLSFIIPTKSDYKTIIGILYKEQLYEGMNENSLNVIDYKCNKIKHTDNNYSQIPLYFRPYRII
jgi:hypothetical protein